MVDDAGIGRRVREQVDEVVRRQRRRRALPIRTLKQSATKFWRNRSLANDAGSHVDGATFALSSASAKRPPETPLAKARAIASLVWSTSMRVIGVG